ncbi:NUDIX domain-containing protein [Alsobacter ponti]
MTATILDARTVHEGWSSFRIVRVRLADGSVVSREVEDHGDAVAVLPYDPARRVALLVEQARPAILSAGGPPLLLEAPAGILEDGEDPAACARREAQEETGVELEALEPVAALWASPGISTEKIHMFLAPYGDGQRTGAGGGLAGEHEQIVVHEVALADLAARVDSGDIADMKTALLVASLRLRRPELFR